MINKHNGYTFYGSKPEQTAEIRESSTAWLCLGKADLSYQELGIESNHGAF